MNKNSTENMQDYEPDPSNYLSPDQDESIVFYLTDIIDARDDKSYHSLGEAFESLLYTYYKIEDGKFVPNI